MISNAKKAVLHIAKAQTGMTDAEYRDLLAGVGVESSKDLNNRTFALVMKKFGALGFKSTSQAKRRKVSNLPQGKAPLMKKLEAIILDMGLSWAYVDSIARNRFKVAKAQWLEADNLRKLVQMMAVHQKRQRRKNV